ncbi:hypothetical protein HK102_013398, partial [Quaeritorhiza haematococci]
MAYVLLCLRLLLSVTTVLAALIGYKLYVIYHRFDLHMSRSESSFFPTLGSGGESARGIPIQKQPFWINKTVVPADEGTSQGTLAASPGVTDIVTVSIVPGRMEGEVEEKGEMLVGENARLTTELQSMQVEVERMQKTIDELLDGRS